MTVQFDRHHQAHRAGSDYQDFGLDFCHWTSSSLCLPFAAGAALSLTPHLRGETAVTVTASDGFSTATNSFRVLVYPRAHELAAGAFAFGEWATNQPAGTYPEHMLFLQSDQNDAALATPLLYAYRIPLADASAAGDADYPYNAAARTRLNGLGTNGVAFINTGRGRDLGGVLLALDTRGVAKAPVSWLGGTVLTNVRVYAVRLQYRVGATNAFADVLDAEGQPVEYVRNAANGHVQTLGPVPLPAGVPNLLRYAFGLDRAGDYDAARPMADVLDHVRVFRHRRLLAGDGGVEYVVESASDLLLSDWTAADVGTDLIDQGAVPTGDGLTETVEYRLDDALLPSPRYVRLRVRLTE